MERIKYPQIEHLDAVPEILDAPVQVFEKLDGANCQVRSESEHLVLGSRSGSTPRNLERAPWWSNFESWAHRFYDCLQEDLYAPLSELLPENYVLFGEWLSPHTLDYLPEVANQFYLLDVYDANKQRFLEYRKGASEVTIDGLIPLNTLRPIATGLFSRNEITDMLPASSYRSGDKEGLVIKNYDRQLFAKIHNEEFSEIRESASGLERYLTMRRVRKAEERLEDQGMPATYDALLGEFVRDLESEARVKDIDRSRVRHWFDKATNSRGFSFSKK